MSEPAFENELNAWAYLLCGHIETFVGRLRQLPADRWDWSPNPAAPTARTLATHAYQWLECDRQHIREPDVSRHIPVTEAPADPDALCGLLAAEAPAWSALLAELTPEKLLEERSQFGSYPANIRWFIGHSTQNLIYKHGQFSEIYFALELDGSALYSAPFPNPIYDEMAAERANSLKPTS